MKMKPFLVVQLLATLFSLAGCRKSDTPVGPLISQIEVDAHGSDAVHHFEWDGNLLKGWTMTSSMAPDMTFAAQISSSGGRVTTIDLPSEMGHEIRKIELGYNGDRIVEIRYNGDVAYTNFVYDDQGQLTAVDRPWGMGEWAVEKHDNTYHLSWGAGNVQSLNVLDYNLNLEYSSVANPLKGFLPLLNDIFLVGFPCQPFFLSNNMPITATITYDNDDEPHYITFSMALDGQGRVYSFELPYFGRTTYRISY